MKARLFQKEQSINPSVFECLCNNDVITAKVSDHHPIIHNGVLFWNVMMKCNERNNGCGISESDKKYMNRLNKVGDVIAEIVFRYPSIEVISLCEGPNERLHIDVLIKSLKKYDHMKRFFPKETVRIASFHQPTMDRSPIKWGILMLADNRYAITKITCDFIENSAVTMKLANRFQLWKLTSNKKDKYLALGHFPFGGDVYKTEKTDFSVWGNRYADLANYLINKYTNDQFILCADFNFNPYLISEWKDRVLDQITNNNSALLAREEKSDKQINMVTVDGILLSAKEKQKYYTSRPDSSLSSALTYECCLFKSSFHQYLEGNRYENGRLQHEYDRRFGLVSAKR